MGYLILYINNSVIIRIRGRPLDVLYRRSSTHQIISIAYG